jgi:hypothetical protein
MSNGNPYVIGAGSNEVMHVLHPRLLYRDLWRGCIGAWCPALGDTRTILFDSSGLGNPRAALSSSSFGVRNGKTVILSSGASSYVDLGAITNLDPKLETFYFGIWVSFASFITTYVASKGNNDSLTIGWSVFTEGSKVVVRCNGSNDGTQRASQTSPTITTNTLYHVGMLINRSSNTITGFLNGSNAGWTNGGSGPANNSLSGIGSIVSSSNAYLMNRPALNAGITNGSYVNDVWLVVGSSML